MVYSGIFIKGVPTCERHSVEKDTHPVHPHLIVKRVYPDFNKASVLIQDLENNTLFSGTYLYRPNNKGVPPTLGVGADLVDKGKLFLTWAIKKEKELCIKRMF